MATDFLDAKKFDRAPSWRFYFQWLQSSILCRIFNPGLTDVHRKLNITDQDVPEILASLAELSLMVGRTCWIVRDSDASDTVSLLSEEVRAATRALDQALQEEHQRGEEIRDEFSSRFGSSPHSELNPNINLISLGQPLSKEGAFARPLAEILSNFLAVHYAAIPEEQLIDYRGSFSDLARVLEAMQNVAERVLQHQPVSLAPLNIKTDSHNIAEIICEHCRILLDYGSGKVITPSRMESLILKLHGCLTILPKSNMARLVSKEHHPIMLLPFGLLKSLDRLSYDTPELLLSKAGRLYLDELLEHLVNLSVSGAGLAWALEDLASFSIEWSDSGQLDKVWDVIITVFSKTDREPSPLRFSSELSGFGFAGYNAGFLDYSEPGNWPFDLKLVMLLGREDHGLVVPDQNYDDLETWNQWVCSTISDSLSRGYLELAEALFALLLLQNARYPTTKLNPWPDIWGMACDLKEKCGDECRAFAKRISTEFASFYKPINGLLSCRFGRIGKLLSGVQTVVDLSKLKKWFETRILSQDEIIDLYHERLGARLFESLNEVSKEELIKFEQLYRQHLYQEKRENDFDWAHVVLMPFRVIEREMALRIKPHISNKDEPTLGTMVTEFIKRREGKRSYLGEIMERIFPALDVGDAKILRKMNFRYRNLSAHGKDAIINRDKTRDLYRDLFEDHFMKRILEKLVMIENS